MVDSSEENMPPSSTVERGINPEPDGNLAAIADFFKAPTIINELPLGRTLLNKGEIAVMELGKTDKCHIILGHLEVDAPLDYNVVTIAKDEKDTVFAEYMGKKTKIDQGIPLLIGRRANRPPGQHFITTDETAMTPISRDHAAILLLGDTAFIRDTNSTNGTAFFRPKAS